MMKDRVLDLDVGNSYTKWRVGKHRGCMVTGELPKLQGEVARVRVSTVAASDVQLSQQLIQTFGVKPEFAKTTKTLAGVQNGYDQVTQLGVDRWLALVAAWNRVQCDLLVFDFGTALTADYVRADGSHLGGYIVPGRNTMRTALGQCTRDVQVSDDAISSLHDQPPARNTNDAVNFGLAHVHLGWVNRCIEVGTQIFRVQPTLIFTGGELTLREALQHLPSHHFPDLVLEGLALALP
ncbi:MAG: type III pantothenate kinase [Gammaproteobacteria bacterium]|nr:type III pantothenate kinase [Gammaproteobacteria bacterium]MYF38012.1 type III pantothenate kinase [Gammaproteobacteria bacterium]